MSSKEAKARYWFPAKRYGWGWGWPCTWQGHVVMLGFLGSFMLGLKVFNPATHPFGFTAYTIALTTILIVICYLKGEPPKWRWGK